MKEYKSTCPERVFSWLVIKTDGKFEQEFNDGEDNRYLRKLEDHSEIDKFGFEGLGHYAFVDRDGNFKTLFDDDIIHDNNFIAYKDKDGELHRLVSEDMEFFQLKGFTADLFGSSKLNINKFKYGYNCTVKIDGLKCRVKVASEYIINGSIITKEFQLSIAPEKPNASIEIIPCLISSDKLTHRVISEAEPIHLNCPVANIDFKIQHLSEVDIDACSTGERI